MKKFLALVLTLVFTLSFAAIAEEKTAVTTYADYVAADVDTPVDV